MLLQLLCLQYVRHADLHSSAELGKGNNAVWQTIRKFDKAGVIAQSSACQPAYFVP